jgi:hypothetical protein
MAGCGCKKKNQAQPVQQPTNVTINVNEAQFTNQQNDVNLTEEQQKQVDAIVDKLKQINS